MLLGAAVLAECLFRLEARAASKRTANERLLSRVFVIDVRNTELLAASAVDFAVGTAVGPALVLVRIPLLVVRKVVGIFVASTGHVVDLVVFRDLGNTGLSVANATLGFMRGEVRLRRPARAADVSLSVVRVIIPFVSEYNVARAAAVAELLVDARLVPAKTLDGFARVLVLEQLLE